MKAFRDWNTGWNAQRKANESSWEITEPAIYYQAVYTLLLSQFVPASTGGRGSAPSRHIDREGEALATDERHESSQPSTGEESRRATPTVAGYPRSSGSMARPNDGLDTGLAPDPQRTLVITLSTHSSRRHAGQSPVRGLSRRPHGSAIELSVHIITTYDIYSSKNDDAGSSA